jgi:hypothetical protein
LKLTLKGAVVLFNNVKGLLDVITDKFNDMSSDCDNYVNSDGHDLCSHNKGDGFCDVGLCPLDKQ